MFLVHYAENGRIMQGEKVHTCKIVNAEKFTRLHETFKNANNIYFKDDKWMQNGQSKVMSLFDNILKSLCINMILCK